MRLIESLKKKKFILINIFFTLYLGVNFIGGERGLFSYFEKKRLFEELTKKERTLINKIRALEKKITLIKNNDLDYLDMIYREKFKYGTRDEIIIKLR